MAYFLKEEDMPTATLEDLRYTKKRCDRWRNLFSGICCFTYAAHIVIHTPVYIIAFIALSQVGMLFGLFMLLAGCTSVVFSVLAKEERKFTIPALASYLVYLISEIIIGEPEVGVISFLVSVPCLFASLHFRNYNEKLSQIKGYPYFNHHEENRQFEALTRLQAIEMCKNGGNIINPEEFFSVDKKSVEKKEVDKSDWLSG